MHLFVSLFRMQEMKQQLDFAMSELDHLKDSRARQAEMVRIQTKTYFRLLMRYLGSQQSTFFIEVESNIE